VLNEYLINLRQHQSGKTFENTIASWGTDEYDALEKIIHKELPHKNGEACDFSLSRVRSTGRKRSNESTPESYFKANVRSYIQGLMTRFMIRFIVSDSIEELEQYKQEFDRYLKKYGEEFPEHITERILYQYNSRKKLLNFGIVNALPLSYDTDEMKEHLAEKAFEIYLEQTVKILRMFGFRVENCGDDAFEVLIPGHYHKITNKKGNRMILNHAELILYWIGLKNKIFPDDLTRYGIKENSSVLELIGGEYEYEEGTRYVKELRKSGLTGFLFEVPFEGYYDLYVLEVEYNKAIKRLRKIHAEFYDPEAIDYDPDDLHRTCEICGSAFSGDDIVCPSCRYNID
jgi:hypothetical protein